jgi:single-stranded-DNA-specific exonuclease
MKTAPAAPDTRWAVTPYPWSAAQGLAQTLGLPFVAAAVLAGRGLTDPSAARRFLECAADIPDPFLFEHMEAAVACIGRAIESGGRVIVHGDYDADGITATATMLLGLRDLGLKAEWYLPSRFNEGYGLSRLAVDAIAAGGPGVLITVDCGVNYPDEVAMARQAGLEVVVVDHHQPGPRLPECHLIHEVVGDYPQGRLCGVGLALKLLHALHVRLRSAAADAVPEALLPLLDLVAIGTIADLAPLTGENRYYVHEGLKLIAIGRRVGLRALAAVSGCTGVADSGTVAFRLAPRLNAPGRLADPSPPLRLLLTEDEREAQRLAQTLHELNGARQDVERQIVEEAVRRVDECEALPPIVVLAGSGWHEGVVGIVASRLVERYNRPAILLGVRDGVAKGSGRSIAAYDLMEGLDACAGHLTVYGGHPQAAGLTLPAQGVDAFRTAIEQHAAARLSGRDLAPRFRADAVIRGEEVNPDTALALSSLGPFGLGNPRPRLLLVHAGVNQPETTRDGSHLRCSVEVDGVRTRGIGFGLGELAEELRTDPRRRLLGAQFRVADWQGSVRTELLIERIGSLTDQSEVWGSRFEPDWSAWQARADGPVSAPVAAGSAGRGLRLPASHDLRDRPGNLTGLAQVLASGEQALVLGCPLPRLVKEVSAVLPLADLVGGEFAWVGRGSPAGVIEETAGMGVVFAEWDELTTGSDLLDGRPHVVALQPPYRAGHVEALWSAADHGATVHLLYGAEERDATVRLLRYLLHPRFAMVCVYRALQEEGTGRRDGGGEEPEGARAGEALVQQAARIGWDEAGVVLARASVERAWAILAAAGIGRGDGGRAKLEARDVPAYKEAEAEFEECVRLCRTL